MPEDGGNRRWRLDREAIRAESLLTGLNFYRTQPFPGRPTLSVNVLLRKQVPGKGVLFEKQDIDTILV